MASEAVRRTAAARAAAADAEATARARTVVALAAAEEAEAAARTAAARGAAEEAEAKAKSRTVAALAAAERAEANARAAVAREIAEAAAAEEALTAQEAVAAQNAAAAIDVQDIDIAKKSDVVFKTASPCSEPLSQAPGCPPSRWKQTVKEVVHFEAKINDAAGVLMIGAETGDELTVPPPMHQHFTDVVLEVLEKSRADKSVPQSPSDSPIYHRRAHVLESLSRKDQAEYERSLKRGDSFSDTSVASRRRESVGESMRRKAEEALDARLLKEKARAEIKRLIAEKKGEDKLSKAEVRNAIAVMFCNVLVISNLL
jgi:hypothetical protein